MSPKDRNPARETVGTWRTWRYNQGSSPKHHCICRFSIQRRNSSAYVYIYSAYRTSVVDTAIAASAGEVILQSLVQCVITRSLIHHSVNYWTLVLRMYSGLCLFDDRRRSSVLIYMRAWNSMEAHDCKYQWRWRVKTRG